MSRPRIVVSLLLSFVIPAAASASFEVAAPGRTTFGDFGGPLVAGNGDGFLAVWPVPPAHQTVGASLDAAGRRRFPSPVGVADMTGAAAHHAFGADSLLDRLIPGQQLPYRYERYRLRAGTVSPEKWETEIPTEAFHLAAVTTGGSYVLLQSWDRQALVLDAQGRLVRRITLPYSPQDPWHASVSSNDREFILTWWDAAALNVQRIPTDGTPVVTTTVATADRYNGMLPFAMAVSASDGNDVLVVYSQRQADLATAMKSARVRADGSVIRNDAFRAPAEWQDPRIEILSVVPLALRRATDHYVLLRSSVTPGSVQAIRLGNDGMQLDNQPVTVATGIQDWHVATRGDRFYIAGLTRIPADRAVIGATFSSTGGVHGVAQEMLSSISAWQTSPSVASDGSAFLTTWRELGKGRAALFNSSGQTLTTIEIPAAGRVSYAAGVYAIVWTTSREVYAVRVSQSGTLLDPQPIAVATGLDQIGELAVASNGSSFLIVWVARRGPFQAVSLAPSGAVGARRDVRPGPPAESGWDLNIANLDVASDGNGFLAVWTAQETFGSDWMEYKPAREETIALSSDGTPRGAARAMEGNAGVRVVWNGESYVRLVPFWKGGSTVLFVLEALDRDGNRIGKIAQFAPPELLGVHDLLFTGGEYVLVSEVSGSRRLIRIGDSVRQFSFGVPSEPQYWTRTGAAVNSAGELVVVVDELRPDSLGARSSRIVGYAGSDFVHLYGRRRAASH